MKNFKKILQKMFANKEEVADPWADLEKDVDYTIKKIVIDNTRTRFSPEMVNALSELLRIKMTIIGQRAWREN